MRPRQWPHLLRPGTSNQRDDRVVVPDVLGSPQQRDRLRQGQRLRRPAGLTLGYGTQRYHVALHLVPRHGPVHRPVEALIQLLKCSGTQRLGLVREPAVDIGRRELTYLPGAERRDDVGSAEVSALGDRRGRPSVEAEGEPIIDDLGHGEGVWPLSHAVRVFTHDLPELGPGLGLGLPTPGPDDPLACRGISDGERGNEALTPRIPMHSAVTATAAHTMHQSAPFLVSCSSSSTYSAIAACGMRRRRPWVTERSRLDRMSS